MSLADSQTPSSGETATTSRNPAWLDFLEKLIKEEKDDYFGDSAPFGIVHDLLLDPDEDDRAIRKAVESVQKDYIAGFSSKEAGRRKPPEYNAGIYLNEISRAVIGSAYFISYTDIKHDRLAAFLIALKSAATHDFDLNDPQFVYYSWGLEEVASKKWNACRASDWTQDDEFWTARQKTDHWVNVTAFLAKLFKGGLLDTDGPRWLSGDFRDAFEEHTRGDVAVSVGRQAQVFAPANHILIAGEALVKEVKTPSQEWWFELNIEKWKLWATKLQEVAGAVGEDAPWGLKMRAQEAHDKMVELYPEAFTESQVASE